MAASSVIVPTFPQLSNAPREQTSLLDPDTVEENVPLDEPADDGDGDYIPRLKKRIIWVYGTGETGVWCAQVIVVFYLNTFLLEVAKLDPVSVSLRILNITTMLKLIA